MESIPALPHPTGFGADAQFEHYLRAQLSKRSKAWLMEQLISIAIPQEVQAEARQKEAEIEQSERAARVERLRQMQLCKGSLLAFLSKHEGCDRQKMEARGYLVSEAPRQGGKMLFPKHRSPTGEALLSEAKDILFGLLYARMTNVEQSTLV